MYFYVKKKKNILKKDIVWQACFLNECNFLCNWVYIYIMGTKVQRGEAKKEWDETDKNRAKKPLKKISGKHRVFECNHLRNIDVRIIDNNPPQKSCALTLTENLKCQSRGKASKVYIDYWDSDSDFLTSGFPFIRWGKY